MNKKFNKIFLLSVILLVSIAFQGCKKDWLEPKPLSIYSPENTFVDLLGFKAGLAGCANNYRGEWYGDCAPIIT